MNYNIDHNNNINNNDDNNSLALQIYVSNSRDV